MNAATRVRWIALALIAASPSTRANDRHALPRVDRCRVVYAFEPGTRLFQASDGSLCLDVEPRVWNEYCAERYATRTLPMPHRRLREFIEVDGTITSYDPLTGIDPQGRPWFLTTHHGEDLAVHWSEKGGMKSMSFAPSYGRHDEEIVAPAQWPWVGGHVLGDENGVWLAGRDKVFRITGDRVKAIDIPAPKGATDDELHDLFGSNNPYWAHQTYALGGQGWLVRSFYSNCHSSGSFVIRFTDDAAAVVARRHGEFVTGLVVHEGEVFMLTERRASDDVTAKGIYTPTAIARVRQKNPPDGLTVHEGEAGSEKRVEENDLLMDMVAARLVFTDRKARQYVQAWEHDKATTKLVVFDGKTTRTLELPSGAFRFGCQGDDGNMYGHDERAIFTFDPEKPDGGFTPVGSMGDVAIDDFTVVAAWRGLLCLDVQTRQEFSREGAPVWIDLRGESAEPMLPGRMIAGGLPRQGNDSDYQPVAPGTDDTLWFVRYKKEPVHGRRPIDARFDVTTQLLRARKGTVETLGKPMATSFNPTVWPVARDTAVVATSSGNDGIAGVLFYDEGEAHREASLDDVLRDHGRRLVQVMPDGAAFRAGDDYGASWLIRLGESFYVEEEVYRRFENGAGHYRSSAIFRDGTFHERATEAPGGPRRDRFRPLVEHVVAVDPATHRVLAFTNDWTTLAWVAIGPEGGEGERLEVRDKAWCWSWLDRTSLPRFEGRWILSPRAARHALEMETIRVAEAKARGSKNPEYDVEMRADDLRTFLRWNEGRWRKVGFSLLGGAVFRDQAGGVWNLRTREAEVSFPDGRSQLIPLDAGSPGMYRLAAESKDAVWVASQESASRFVRQLDGQGHPEWQLDRRYRLPRFGIAFAGPWIVGTDFYWVSDGRLFLAPLADFIDPS